MAEQFPVVTTPDGIRWWDVYGRLIPCIAGADPAALFPEVPDDLSGHSRDDLAALAAQITERAQQVTDALTSGDAEARAEVLGEVTTKDAIAAAQAALDARDRIDAEIQSRVEAEEAEAEQLAALAARAGGDADEGQDDEPEADADTDGEDDESEDADEEPVAEPEPDREPVAAAAAAAPTAAEIAAEVIRQAGAAAQRPARRRTAARHAPREEQGGDRATMTLTAGADIPGFSLGQEITSREEIGRAFGQRMRSLGRASSTADGERVPVIRRTVTLPDDRQLGGDAALNTDRIDAIMGRQAVVAAGGICAPPEPLYDVPTYFVADTPVRAALPAMQAPRGGITYMQPITIASGIGAGMADATGFMTVDEDAAITNGTPDNTKDCYRIECGSFVDAEIEAIYQCITVGNMDARTFPERIAALVDAADAARARKAEGRFLDLIKAASTTVSENVGFGALIDFVGAILKSRAGMISRHRMSRDQRFHVLMPFWVSEALPMDALRGGNGELARAAVQAALERYGVSITWYLDSPSTGTSQVFASQSASTLRDFPSTVQWAIYPEGSFGYLDSGELDLGLVRDSTLNSTNDYQLFAEEFVKVFYRGVEAYWVNQTVCYSGQTQVPGSILDCAYNVTTDTDGS